MFENNEFYQIYTIEYSELYGEKYSLQIKRSMKNKQFYI